MSDDQIYQEYVDTFSKLSDEEIIKTYKNDLGNPGWVRQRGIFLSALGDELKKRGIVNPKLKASYYCPKCEKEITSVPLSNHRENGKLWHIPHNGKAKCDDCGWESGPYGHGLVKK